MGIICSFAHLIACVCRAIHDKKIADEKAANDAKKHKKEEEKAAKAFAKAAAAGGSAEDVGTRFVNPLDETFGNVDSGRSPSVDAAPRVEHAPDDLTIDVYHGGGKKYRAVLPGIIRATVDFHSAKLGNLHPPEEIVRSTVTCAPCSYCYSYCCYSYCYLACYSQLVACCLLLAACCLLLATCTCSVLLATCY